MELNNQVCTIEQSKRLVELGVFEPCLFVHFTAGSHSGIALGGMYKRHIWILTGVAYEDDEINITPAYTVAELGVMLPFYLVNYGELTIKKNYRREKQTGWNVSYEKSGDYKGVYLPKFCSETQAGSVCLMLIHLLENKLITPQQVNASLTQQQ